MPRPIGDIFSPLTLRDALGRGDTPAQADPLRKVLPGREAMAPRVEAYLAALADSEAPPPEPTRAVCGGMRCNRLVWVHELFDVRPLPESLRGAADFVCSACIERWYLQGKLTPAELLAYWGATVARQDWAREKHTTWEQLAQQARGG